MSQWLRYGLIIIACGVLFAGTARTDDTDNSSVSDGPSRAELFEARMQADMGPAFNPLAATAKPAFILPRDIKDELIFGIDVSHHNDENCACKPGQPCAACKINWDKAQSQKISFVYLKASQGTRYRDPTFDYHWQTLAEHKISRGAYHFMSADEDPIKQAENFLDKLDDAGKMLGTDLPPCLDLESDIRKDNAKRWFVTDTGAIRDFWLGQDPDDIIAKVLKWLRHVEEKTGRTPIVYTSRGWWNDRIKDENKFALLKRYPIWISNYTDSGSFVNVKPKVPNDHTWTLWQFTDSGRTTDTETVPGKVDVNIFNGNLGTLEAALGVTVPPPVQVASNEPANDASKPADQVATNNPPANGTDKPTEQAAANNPAPPSDANKLTDQVAANEPAKPADADKPAENKPTEQTAATNPASPSDANKPSEQVASTEPNSPVVENKPSEQTASTQPASPSEPAKLTEQTASTNTTPSNEQVKLTEQTASTESSKPADTSKPSEQTATANPPAPSDANKPTEQAAVVVPSAPNETKPPEQAAADNPSPPNDTGKPAEQVAGTAPAAPSDANKPDNQKPSQRVAAVNPVEPNNDAKPADQQANPPPNDSKQSTETPPSRTNSRNRTSRNAAQKLAEAKTPVESASVDKTVADKMTIEIVLLNGRVLRVDANIDPALLARLVTAIDRD